MVLVTTLLGTLLAALVAGVVLFDARDVGLDRPPVWGLCVGVASFACFVVGEALTLPIWLAVVGTEYVASPWYLVLVGTAIGVLLSLVALGAYGLGTRRSIHRPGHGAP